LIPNSWSVMSVLEPSLLEPDLSGL
jgi:hypothetical protein